MDALGRLGMFKLSGSEPQKMQFSSKKSTVQLNEMFWTCDIEIPKPLNCHNIIIPRNLTSGYGHVTSGLASLREHSRVLPSPRGLPDSRISCIRVMS